MIFGHRLGYRIWRQVRFFFQRLFRGWDDSDTWSLDVSFYKWLKPRLERFVELTNSYPDTKEYPTMEKWKKDLKKRLGQLEHLIAQDDLDFDDWSYIPKKKRLEYECDTDIYTTTINMLAFDYMAQDFNKWFSKHINQLWW